MNSEPVLSVCCLSSISLVLSKTNVLCPPEFISGRSNLRLLVPHLLPLTPLLPKTPQTQPPASRVAISVTDQEANVIGKNTEILN